MTPLAFWAQALDNAAPDLICIGDQLLGEAEATRRQEVVSVISAVVKAGTRVFDERGTRLTADGYRFVLEVPSAERDVVGRVAPIVCCGEYSPVVSGDFGTSVTLATERFARDISRTLGPDHARATREAFEALKKKSSRQRLARTSWIVLLIMAMLALLCLVALRGS